MFDALNVRCDKTHDHQPLIGGQAAAAAFYPAPLLRAILKGMADTKNSLGGVKMITGNERNVIDTLNTFVAAIPRKMTDDNTTAPTALGGKDSNDAEVCTSSIPLRNGGSIPIQYKDENFKTIYTALNYGKQTGKWLFTRS